MPGRAVLRWLLLVAVPVLALGHGFAGAATHLPHHPDSAFLMVAGDSAAAEACAAEPYHDEHDGTACEAVTSGGTSCRDMADAAASAALGDEERLGGPSCDSPAPARSPPKPSLSVLSVLRI